MPNLRPREWTYSARGANPAPPREEAGEPVHAEVPEGDVLVPVPLGVGAAGVPLDVHHHVFPAEGAEIGGHIRGVPADVRLGDGGVVVVVAVPSHGRAGREEILFHAVTSSAFFLQYTPVREKLQERGETGENHAVFVGFFAFDPLTTGNGKYKMIVEVILPQSLIKADGATPQHSVAEP